MTADGPEPPTPHETGGRLAGPADRGWPDPSDGDPADYVAEGMGYLDQAIAAFSQGCESGDSGIVPLAIELLARTLPLRGRDNDAALFWRPGLKAPARVATPAAPPRPRRAFGGEEVPADEDGA